jgi:DNA primase
VAKEEARVLEVAGREVRITNPGKPYFSKELRLTKLELVAYYLSVAEGALNGIRDRPIVLKRFVDGAQALCEAIDKARCFRRGAPRRRWSSTTRPGSHGS